MQQERIDHLLDSETRALLEEYAQKLGLTPNEYLAQAIASHRAREAAQSSPDPAPAGDE